MKTIILTIVLLISNILIGQHIPNMDTTKSILLVSHYHSTDKPILSLLKRNQDIIFFINLDDKDIFTFCDAEYYFHAKIKELNLDSTGHIHIYFTITHKRRLGTTNIDGKICHTVGDEFFTMVIDNKMTKHTSIKCEFHKEKLMNVDY
jgi:hypothetical protein